MDCIRAVVQFVSYLDDHTLINVPPASSDRIHDRSTRSRIQQYQMSDGFANANHIAVVITRRALLVVNDDDFPRTHMQAVALGQIVNRVVGSKSEHSRRDVIAVYRVDRRHIKPAEEILELNARAQREHHPIIFMDLNADT